MIPGIGSRILRSAAGGPEISHTANLLKTGDDTVATFTDVALGVAVAGRLIGLALYYRGQGSDLASVTIGGVAATLGTEVFNSSYNARLAWAVVPTGATGDIVTTSDNNNFRNLGASVFRMVGLASSTPVSEKTATGGANPEIVFVGAPSNGVAIYSFFNGRNNEGVGTWTNGPTEVYEDFIEGEIACAAMFGTGAVPNSAYQRDSDPGVDLWNSAAAAGACWA